MWEAPYPSSAEMWADKLALCQWLHSLQLKEGQNIQEHVKTLTETFDELPLIGGMLMTKTELFICWRVFLIHMRCYA